MCGCGRTSTLRGRPGGNSTGPMWSKNTNGPTLRAAAWGSTRPTSKPPRSRRRCSITRSITPSSRSVEHDAADRLAPVHQVERVVDLLERHRVGDQRVDLALPVHVPVDDAGDVGAAARAAEGGALPGAARDELEGTRRDLGARGRDADDHRDAPAAVRALERLAHRLHVADALEAVAGAALRHVDEARDEVALHVSGGHAVRHAEALGERALARVQVDADDLHRAREARALD